MLIFGSAKLIEQLSVEKFVILNFSSLVNNYEQLHLIPDPKTMPNTEYEFDQAYANWIMSNDEQFIDLMKIVFPLFCGYNVFVVVNWYEYSESPYLANINETLIKFIQDRYGYSASIINTEEDYLGQHRSSLESDFSIEGLANMDFDKSILAYKLQSHMNQYGVPINVVGFKYVEVNV